MNPIKPVRLGIKVKAKTFARAIEKSVRPEERHVVMQKLRKEEHLTINSPGNIPTARAKKIVGKLEHEEELRNAVGTQKRVLTHGTTEKHILEAIMVPEPDKAAERRAAIKERVVAAEEEEHAQRVEAREARREQKEVARREKVKQTNLANVRAEHAREMLEEISLPGSKKPAAGKNSSGMSMPIAPARPFAPLQKGDATKAIDVPD